MDPASQSDYSDPGRHRALLEAIEPTPAAISHVCRTLIAHYRAHGDDLPPGTRDDIHSRWLEVILDRASERQPGALDQPRALHDRVQGCCRDHALLGGHPAKPRGSCS